METKFDKKDLTKKSENIADWYNDVIKLADVADYAETRGGMIIKPLGYALWESVQQVLDKQFKEDGIMNVYFPAFIPMSLFEKEKAHIKGFAPELFMIKSIGDEDLLDPYVLRPTSEAIIDKALSKWIKSYRDLPYKINQWCNIFRAEKRTYYFLRTTEFLWQEGHTSFCTAQETLDMTLKALNWYKDFYEQYFAISGYVGLKSQQEKFAGAKNTYTIEMVAPNGKSIQMCTSHDLGDNFAKVFNIQYIDENGEKQYVYQNSFGLSTRSLGCLILAHGDDFGLILPPKVAPIQIVILPIITDNDNKEIIQFSENIYKQLSSIGIKAKLDVDFKHTLGYRINEWEIKGVPLRLEVGQRELDNNVVSAVRRDNFEKSNLDIKDILNTIPELLLNIQNDLLQKSRKLKNDLTIDVSDYNEFKKAINDGKFVRAFWCEDEQCEEAIKQETKASNRCLELDRIESNESGECIYCHKKAKRRWLFAKSY